MGEIVEKLLHVGANSLLYECRGNTAYDLAIQNNKVDTMNALQSFKECYALRKKESTYVQYSFNCDVCKINVKNATLEEHQTSTLHLFNLKIKPNVSPFSITENNRGYQMMLNLGWDEKGLGLNNKGRILPIKTILRKDRQCLGSKSKLAAKVTHFDPFDDSAVISKSLTRIPRLNTLQKKETLKQIKKDKEKEKWFRREF